MNHLRYAGLSFEEQSTVLCRLVQDDPLVATALAKAQALGLPDWLLVSGAIYNTVWNRLTGKPSGYGIKDVDLFYHDASDTSYEAEDAVISRSLPHFEGLGRPVEIRNQARVHLWYEARFGNAYPQLASSAEALRYFASKTHSVGLRSKADGHVDVVAPFGLDDIFAFRIAPNRALDNRVTHRLKGERACRYWPEVTVMPW